MRIVTIKDVARAAGVSISTVSRVLNNRQDVDPETRARVLAQVKKLNYVRNQSASNLKQQNVSAIGVILRGRRNSFLMNLAEQVLQEGRGTGFQFIMEIIDEKASQYLAARQLYMDRRLQGVIFLGSNLEGQEEEVRRLELPQVYATIQAGHLDSWHIASVSVDNRLAGQQAVEKLLALGHQQIALLGYFAGESDSTGQRLHGAVDAMRRAGLQYDPELFCECNFTLASGYEGVKRLLACGKPFTGLFCSSDIIAMGAIRALLDEGLSVPGDVSVIGFDGIEVGQYLNPSLTTFCQPVDIIARESVRLMRQLIENQQPEHLLVSCQFLPGGSIRQI